MSGPNGERCLDCFYYDGSRCKRYPPQVSMIQEENVDGTKWTYQQAESPEVFSGDWCGEYKKREDGNDE